jgi:multiple sugar transport system permease protein
MRRNQNKKTAFSTSQIIAFAILLVLGVIMIIPFILMMSISFERLANITIPYPPKLFPSNPSWFNYNLVFQNGGLWYSYMNSGIVAVSSVIIKLACAILAGYAFSKGKFRGKRLLFMIFLATLMIPLEARLIPLYLMWNKLHFLDTFWPIILPNFIDAFMIFFAKQFFDELPDSLREASRMDGAGEFKTFFLVYFPLSGPVTATISILAFMWNWNDFLWPLIILTSQKLHTVPLYLASFSLQYRGTYAGMSMALSALATLPVIIVYLFLQKYIIQSVALSGLKGE